MSDESTFEFKRVIGTIKSICKNKKLTYKDLGLKIGMSESGIKKVFTGKDCSFSKLSQICNVLDVSLADVIHESQRVLVIDEKFTPEIEDFFAKNMKYFYYFWKLVAERQSIEEIQSYFGLSESENFGYLKKLDEFNLIELGPNEKIKIPKLKVKNWVGKGPLTKKVYTEWTHGLVDDLVADKLSGDIRQNNNMSFSIRMMRLTSSSIKDLKKAIEELELEFLGRSNREVLTMADEVKTIRFIAGHSKGSFIDKLWPK